MGVSCVAVLAVRNEELHLRRTLEDLIGQGLDMLPRFAVPDVPGEALAERVHGSLG